MKAQYNKWKSGPGLKLVPGEQNAALTFLQALFRCNNLINVHSFEMIAQITGSNEFQRFK